IGTGPATDLLESKRKYTLFNRVATLINKSGLHARPAAEFVKCANSYRCTIDIRCDGRVASAKSIIALMALGADHGKTVEIIADGEDEAAAVKALVSLVEAGFGEVG
ncbi:MAG: HPr family phosphocarrier protein, partial [Propionicimonas sp.]|nr:HPr family phosphocarrier protein [Propionicimonas sp.]